MVIDVNSDRINPFKSAYHSLIYDFNQDGYDVTVEIKDGEQFPNKFDNLFISFGTQQYLPFDEALLDLM